MAKQNKQLKQYYQSIRASLPCPWKLKHKILSEIKSSVQNYLTEHPDAGIDDLEQQFGSPEQITASYLDEMDQQKLAANLKTNKRFIAIVAVGIAAALLMLAVTLGIMIYENHISNPGYIEVTIGTPEIIEED